MRWVVVLAMSTLTVACSNQQVYTAIQQNQQFECSKLPQAQAEDCLRQFDTSYEEYEEDLQELTDDQSQQPHR